MRMFAVLRKYTKSHEWIEFDTTTNIGTMGISDHAQAELGDIVHVDLPAVGDEFGRAEAITCVESVKTAADVYQPCDGEVLEVNPDVEADGAAVNEDAEGKGWLMKIRITDVKQLDDLMSEAEYKASF